MFFSRYFAVTLALCSFSPTAWSAPDPQSAAQTLEAGRQRGAFAEQIRTLEASGDYPALLELTRGWQQEHPTDAQAPFYEALALYYNGDFSGAIVAWEKSIVVDPTFGANARTWLEPARALQKRWGDQAPLQLVESDVTLARKEWGGRARTLLQAKNYDEIERVAAQLTQSKAMTIDGTWMLHPFFNGLIAAPGADSELKWEARRAALTEWQKAKPESALARAALAGVWVKGAWLARGTAYADQTSPTAFKTMEQRLDKIGEILEGGGDLKTQLQSSPVFTQVLDNWALLAGVEPETYAQLMSFVRQKYPTLWGSYGGEAFRLQPRWYGEPGDWEALAARSADQIGGTQGDALYARIVWDIAAANYKYENIWKNSRADWPRTKRGLEALLREAPDSLAAQTIAFELGFRAQDWEFARAMLTQIGGKVDAGYYGSREAFAKRRVYVLKQQ